MIHYPAPLKENSRIAISAFSAGVPEAYQARLDLALNTLRTKKFQVIEGQWLRQCQQHVSAPAEQRAKELMNFLLDPTIDAIFAPWGGGICPRNIATIRLATT